jgi:predicted Fe-S protein YdhL (DUF1289 family)
MKSVKTPCIGICSTTSFGDLVCRGCKRYGFEVIRWNVYDDAAKNAVLMRLEALQSQLYSDKLRITSKTELQQGLQGLGIGFDEALSPWCWVHNLLTKNHRQIRRLQDFGLEAVGAFAVLSIPELTARLDDELLELSEAHYQRYYSLGEQA